MIRRLTPFLLIFSMSCGDDDDDGPPGTNGYWPPGDPDWEFSGDLEDGVVIDLDWAASVVVDYCWPATENVNFTGNHTFHEGVTQAEDYHIYARVEPEGGVDVSLYAIQFAGEVQIPPDITASNGCEAGFDQSGDHNPGKKEEIFLHAHNAYDILIGVAGANGTTSGSYTVEVWTELWQ